MGEAERVEDDSKIQIRSDFYFYGDAASSELSAAIAADIATQWNQCEGISFIKNHCYQVEFIIRGYFEKDLPPDEVWFNVNPRNNYFRIEEFSPVHVSFVDDIPGNTGYFKLDNLLNNSTTAAHEYGHSLGLKHPEILDIRGEGQPGMMYPRGTVCDPLYQYDPAASPLKPGGTLNPFARKVLQKDIDLLRLHKLDWNEKGIAVLGDFTSLYHEKELLPP